MNNRARFILIMLHVLAALTVLIMVGMFVLPHIQDLYGLAFVWKVATLVLALISGVEITAWALRKEKKWAWRTALSFCSLYLIVLLPLGMVVLLGSGKASAWFCKSGLVDCRVVSLGELAEQCKTEKSDCTLENVPIIAKPVREQIQTFNINIGDHVAPDKPAPGAGRIETPDTIDRYLFTVSPETPLALKPENPCTFGYYSGLWEVHGPSQTVGGNSICIGNDRMVLKEGGTYSLTISPGETGEYAFTLVQLSGDAQSYTLNIGDHVAPDNPSSGAGRIETPGSLDRYTFTAEAGTRIALKAEPPCNDKLFSSIDDTHYWSILNCRTTRYFMIKRTGPHTITVKGGTGETGDYGFVLKLPD